MASGPIASFVLHATFSRRPGVSNWKEDGTSVVFFPTITAIQRVAQIQILRAEVERAWFKSNSFSWLTLKGTLNTAARRPIHINLSTSVSGLKIHQLLRTSFLGSWPRTRAQNAGCNPRFYGQNKSKDLCCVCFYDRTD